MKQIDKDKIVEAVRKEFGYDESINLSPLAENIGLAFNENIEEAVKEAIRMTAKELKKSLLGREVLCVGMEKDFTAGSDWCNKQWKLKIENEIDKWLGGDEEI